MSLPNDLTPAALRDLAVRMVIMTPAELRRLVALYPERVRGVALLAATAAGMIEPGTDEG